MLICNMRNTHVYYHLLVVSTILSMAVCAVSLRTIFVVSCMHNVIFFSGEHETFASYIFYFFRSISFIVCVYKHMRPKLTGIN